MFTFIVLQHESIFFFLQELEALRCEMEKKEQEILELEALLQQDTKGPSAGMLCTSLYV